MLTVPQLAKYLQLPQKGKITAEYVWIDGSNGVRSKSRVSIFFPAFCPNSHSPSRDHGPRSWQACIEPTSPR